MQQLKVVLASRKKQYYEMPEFVGFQTMRILVIYNGITFDAVGVFGLAFHLLFKSFSTSIRLQF